MNWIVYIIAAYLCLALDLGLHTLLALPDAGTGVSPSFMLILAVFIGLLAPSAIVPWAMLICGLLLDLTQPVQGGVVVIGPAALGYLVGAYAVIQLRALVFRHSLFTLAVMVLVVGLFVQLTIVAVLTMRGLPLFTGEPLTGWSAAEQLEQRFFVLLYSMAAAVPVGLILFKSAAAWGFGPKSR